MIMRCQRSNITRIPQSWNITPIAGSIHTLLALRHLILIARLIELQWDAQGVHSCVAIARICLLSGVL